MQVRQAVAMLALVAIAGASAAHADTVYTVTAAIDPIFNAITFEIDNLSATTLTGVDISSGSTNKLQLDIDPHSSEIYTFDDLLGGPFDAAAGDHGLPDTTSYQVTAHFQGETVTTSLFSSVVNLTGHYVDFLGACAFNHGGCSQDPSVAYDPSGVVAQGVSSVPLPASLPLLAGGLLGLARRIWRRSQGQA